MRNTSFVHCSVAAIVASVGVAGTTLGDDVLGGAGLARLQASHPDARTLTNAAGRVVGVYGAPMMTGRTPAMATENFLANHRDVFGIENLDLRLNFAAFTTNNRFQVTQFSQYIDGTPVELGMLNVLVTNGPTPTVVYSAAKLAKVGAEGLNPEIVPGDEALRMAKQQVAAAGMDHWHEPELVVYFGEGDAENWIPAVRCWKLVGHGENAGEHVAATFFLNASTGEVVFIRDEIHHADVSGTVKGMATPGLLPDIATNLPVATNLSDITVGIVGGNSVTALGGIFTIPHSGTTQVNVSASLRGPFLNVTNNGAASITASELVTPPGPANLLFNTAPSELTTSQVNIMIHATNTRRFLVDRLPTWTGLNLLLAGNANLPQTCNAFYSSANQSINFYTAGGGCRNTAFSTVIAHEFGHFVVNRRGLAQGAFGEGYGDSIGILMYDTPIVGDGFRDTGGAVRTPGTIVQAYPCNSTAIHTCGQILGGSWWRIRQNFGTRYGSQAGLDQVRDLFADWTLVTAGGIDLNSAHPQTAIEVLTLDDNDGNLANGTPNYAQICAAYSTHSISCPAVSLLAFNYPNGRPASVTPGTPTQVRVDVVGLSSQPVPNTGRLFARINGGAFVQTAMTQIAPNQYIATLPAASCLDSIDYYVQADSQAGTGSDPSGAPGAFYSTIAATGSSTAVDDAFETAVAGWVVGDTGDNATAGLWNRMDPQATAAQPGDDHTPAPGVNCWVTDGVAGASIGERDVDGGKTTLRSPVFDLSGAGEAKFSYWRWYSNNQGAAPGADTFRVDLSNNGGTTWTNVETVGPTGTGTTGGWIFKEFNAGDILPLTSQMRIRFVAEDIGSGSIVEAAIDDFKIVTLECGAPCYADCDTATGPGVLDIFDFLCFQNRFASATAYACDCDTSTGPGVCDVFDFLCFQNAFAAGCP